MGSPRQNRNKARRARHRAMWEAMAADGAAKDAQKKREAAASAGAQFREIRASQGKLGGRNVAAAFGRSSNILADILTLVDPSDAERVSLGGGL
jgi:hypothetical protein